MNCLTIRDLKYVHAIKPWSTLYSFSITPGSNISSGSSQRSSVVIYELTGLLFGQPVECQLSCYRCLPCQALNMPLVSSSDTVLGYRMCFALSHGTTTHLPEETKDLAPNQSSEKTLAISTMCRAMVIAGSILTARAMACCACTGEKQAWQPRICPGSPRQRHSILYPEPKDPNQFEYRATVI